ncbi:MAG TPA: alpha/beta hydrolase [Pseudomonadales bacterium]
MATFVLVHGAWHGAWCWKRVRKALQLKGHDVFTPTLTGLAERSHLLTSDVDLETHIEDVARLIQWEELNDVVLCGHSYGGCVISGVAERMTERIKALVYLDAFVLADGQCLNDMVPPARQGDEWKLPPISAERFNVNSADRAWVDRQCTMHPRATFEQPIRLSGNIDRVNDITYVLATDFEGSPFHQFYEGAKQRGWKTREIACGHDVMLDRPAELTGLLLEIAA